MRRREMELSGAARSRVGDDGGLFVGLIRGHRKACTRNSVDHRAGIRVRLSHIVGVETD